MATVTITFKYDPEEPDDHDVGMSEAEYERVNEALMMLGGHDIEFEKGGA